MAYAELAALRPRAGGEYVYLRAAFGRLAAFLTGWTSFVAGFSGAIAASAVVLAFYVGRFVPVAGRRDAVPRRSRFRACPLTISPQSLVALAAIALMSWIHLRGVGPGRWSATCSRPEGLGAGDLHRARLQRSAPDRWRNLTQSAGAAGGAAWLFALIPVMFTYAGWNAASYVAEEIRDPGRNVPRRPGARHARRDRDLLCC